MQELPVIPSSPVRVSLDLTSLLGPVTGVGTFTREVAAGLAERPDVDLTGFAVTWRGRGGLAAMAPAGATVRTRPLPARLARLAWHRLDVPSARWLGGPAEVVHGPNFVVPPGGGATEVVTVHDLTALHHPDMCTADVLEWPPLLRRALRRGAWVHTVSAFVADEVREAFPEAGDRVMAVANGIRPPAPSAPSEGVADVDDPPSGPPTIVAVGTVEPRKDYPTLVAAFDLLATEHGEVRLVIAGGDGLAGAALTAAMDRSPFVDRIDRLGRVDDARRDRLVREATVVAYPSRYEGFGLVPLEAMAVDVPVVATSVGAIPEVVADAALLVAPRDPEALAAALARALDDEDERRRLVAAGRLRVQRFTWERTVDGIVDLYRRTLA